MKLSLRNAQSTLYRAAQRDAWDCGLHNDLSKAQEIADSMYVVVYNDVKSRGFEGDYKFCQAMAMAEVWSVWEMYRAGREFASKQKAK